MTYQYKTVSKLDMERVLDTFSINRSTAIKQFRAFSNKFGENEFIDYEGRIYDEKRKDQEQEALIDLQNLLSAKGLCSKDLPGRENVP